MSIRTKADPNSPSAAPIRPEPARASLLTRRSPWIVIAVPVGAIVVAIGLSLSVGSNPSTPAEIWHALFQPSGTDMDVTIREIRWPRTLAGVAAGMCLGMAGALTQGHTRNAVADPGLLGINHGAALAIVAYTFFVGTASIYTQASLAFLGAFIASALVFLIGTAARNGGTAVTLVLAGAAVTALCGGLVTGLVLLDEASLDVLRFWQVGSLASHPEMLRYLWPFVLLGLALAVINIGPLNALALGEDMARSLGTSVLRARCLGVAAITVLAGTAVTLAGPIAFAGLLVPHVARAVVGTDYRRLIPASAAFGVGIVLLADVIGRVVARPGELSVGVMLAVVGAPFFIYLARKRQLVTV